MFPGRVQPLCIGGLVHEDILLLRIVVVIGGFLGCRRVAFAFEFVAYQTGIR